MEVTEIKIIISNVIVMFDLGGQKYQHLFQVFEQIADLLKSV